MTWKRNMHNWRLALWGGLGAVALLGAIGGAWVLSLPPAPAAKAAPPIAQRRSMRRSRP
jgi:uncharacterized membrane protein YfcA